jgi:hypothetical protein
MGHMEVYTQLRGQPSSPGVRMAHEDIGMCAQLVWQHREAISPSVVRGAVPPSSPGRSRPPGSLKKPPCTCSRRAVDACCLRGGTDDRQDDRLCSWQLKVQMHGDSEGLLLEMRIYTCPALLTAHDTCWRLVGMPG